MLFSVITCASFFLVAEDYNEMKNGQFYSICMNNYDCTSEL